MTWWNEFWAWAQMPLGATIVGTAIVVIATGIVSRVPALRTPVFGGIARAARFAWGSRPARNARNYTKDIESRKAAVAEALKTGYAKRDAEVQAERTAPRIKPSWAVKRHGPELPKAHVLINYEPSAVQTHVQLSAPIDKFAIDGTGHWKDGVEHILNKHWCEGHFQGGMKAAAVKGVTFTITYRDENGDEHTDYAHLDPVPVYARMSSATTTRRIVRGRTQ